MEETLYRPGFLAGEAFFLAFIESPEVIEKILTHLGLWPAPAHSPLTP